MKDFTSLSDGSIRLEIGLQGILGFHESNGQTLIDTRGRWPLLPVIDGQTLEASFSGMSVKDGCVEITLTPASSGPVAELRLLLSQAYQAIDLRCEFRLRRDAVLNALEVFPKETLLNFYDVINFRNRHFSAATWPELLLGQHVKTSTYSDDWQFAPHPTALLLKKGETTLFVGFADLQAAFGMRMESSSFHVQSWQVDFGTAENGLRLARGESFRSGRLRLFLRDGGSPHDLFTEFGRMLVADKVIPDPHKKERHAWWQEPLYCTWGDQWMQGENKIAESLVDQTAESASPAAALLTEALIWQAVDVIQREKFPIRTIILDEGWAVARGDWRPHPGRLPNLRGIVDRLHALGFKVMVWWNWAEIANDADVDPRYLVNGGWTNKHGCRWRDYSDPTVQEGYLRPLFRTLFSSDEGCLDLDGVKTDFLADKVHPEMPLANPQWRGEEVYFQNVTELFYREMRKHKADACHLGCAGNYWLAEHTDLNRTYDVHSSNWMEHEERGRMLACTTPGVPVSYDMMTCTENTDRWFQSAHRMGASVEIGNLLTMRKDCPSRPVAADAGYWQLLRKGFQLTARA